MKSFNGLDGYRIVDFDTYSRYRGNGHCVPLCYYSVGNSNTLFVYDNMDKHRLDKGTEAKNGLSQAIEYAKNNGFTEIYKCATFTTDILETIKIGGDEMKKVKVKTLQDLEFAFNRLYLVKDMFADAFWSAYSQGRDWTLLLTEKEYKEYLDYVK